jgi:hypothetical protein
MNDAIRTGDRSPVRVTAAPQRGGRVRDEQRAPLIEQLQQPCESRRPSGKRVRFADRDIVYFAGHKCRSHRSASIAIDSRMMGIGRGKSKRCREDRLSSQPGSNRYGQRPHPGVRTKRAVSVYWRARRRRRWCLQLDAPAHLPTDYPYNDNIVPLTI